MLPCHIYQKDKFSKHPPLVSRNSRINLRMPVSRINLRMPVSSCFCEQLGLLLKSESHLKKIALFASMKTNEKCFLFYLKNSFYSQDISVFVLNIWSFRKNILIRNIRLILKFMTSQPG